MGGVYVSVKLAAALIEINHYRSIVFGMPCQ